MRTAHAMTAVTLVALLVTGCSSSAGTAENKPFGLPGIAEPAPLAKLSVPSSFDGSQGWDETLSWVPQSATTLPVTVVPRSGTVAFMQAASNGYTISARASNGKLAWRSAPWKPPAPTADAQGSSSGVAEIPDVTGVEIDGRGYVVAYAHGLLGKDQLHEGAEIVRLAVFPADAQGEAVKPLREIDVPVSADPGQIRVQATGGRLLVAWGENGLFPRRSAMVNVTSGEVTGYPAADRLLPQCDHAPMCTSSRVVAATVDGPLVSMSGGGFGIPGRYFSDTLAPDGVNPKNGFLGFWNGSVYGAAAGRMLISWQPGGNSYTPIWSVHDTRTGALQARLTCGQKAAPSDHPTRDYPVVSSPDGQYLAAGSVVFDLKNKRGICLESDGNRKTIAVASIRNGGTAYGAVQDSETADVTAAAQLDLNTPTGEAKVLETGTDVPLLHTADGAAVFLTRNGDKGLTLAVRRPAHS